MKKTTLFEKAFKRSLKKKKSTEEDENSVGGGVLGPAAAVGHTQGDFYAPGDYRKPFTLGAVQTRRGAIKSKRKKRRKNKKS